MRIIVIQRDGMTLGYIRSCATELNSARAGEILFTTLISDVLEHVSAHKDEDMLIISSGVLDDPKYSGNTRTDGGSWLARMVKQIGHHIFFCLYSILPIVGSGIDAKFEKKVGADREDYMPLARMLTMDFEGVHFNMMGRRLREAFPTKITLY